MKRQLSERIKEHKKSIIDKKINTGLLYHATTKKHSFHFNNIKILDNKPNEFKRRHIEMINI